jgi:putative transcriptional regulator
VNENLSGRLLVASPTLLDPNFIGAVILILEHNDDGAFGLVLNHPSDSPVEDHLPWLAGRTGEPGVVFVGGPVEPAIAIALERSEEGTQPTPLHGVAILDVGSEDGDSECRVYSGYSGWGAGQLEGEIDEEAWITVDAAAADVFSADPQGLWHRVLRRQGGHLSLLATYPRDPSLN